MKLRQNYLMFQCIILLSAVLDAANDCHDSGGYLKPVPLYQDVENPYSTPYGHVEEIDNKDSHNRHHHQMKRICTTTINFNSTATLTKSFYFQWTKSFILYHVMLCYCYVMLCFIQVLFSYSLFVTTIILYL